MKRKLSMMFLLIGLLVGFTANSQDRADMEKGHIRIKLTEAASQQLQAAPMAYSATGVARTSISSIDQVNKKYGVYRMERTFPEDPRYEARHRKYGLHLWYDVYFDETKSPSAIVKEYAAKSELVKAEPALAKELIPFKVTPFNGNILKAGGEPFNDPMLPNQWHYNNTGQTGGIPGCDIRLYDAWKKTAGTPNVIVSIHDQGIDVSHVDIAANMWVNLAELNGKAGVDDDKNGFVDDINGYNFRSNSGKLDAEEHGTHVAGTVAAVNNNGIGVCGIAGGTGNNDGVRLMSVEILGGANTARSYIYAADNGAVISQNSWGYIKEGVYEEAVYDAIKYYIAEAGNYAGSPMKGGVVIFAAGNNDDDGEYYPSAWPEVIAVSALDPYDKKTSYSNYDTWVDISAPGGESNYNYKSGVLSLAPRNKYAYMDGTSMACPHVSGVAALAVSANAGATFTAEKLKQTLLTAFRPIDAQNPNYLGKLGAGAIEASLAVKKNMGKGPNAITSLKLNSIAQDFAKLEWTCAGDEDDGYTEAMLVYYSDKPITADNIANTPFERITSRNVTGDKISYEVKNLSPITTYYFTVVSLDRWNNRSALSNIVEAKTNAGPHIAFDKERMDFNIDAASQLAASDVVNILNTDEGLLRWTGEPRQVYFYDAWAKKNITYPTAKAYTGKLQVGKVPFKAPAKEGIMSRFTPDYINYTDYNQNLFMIGEQDTSYTNSAAQKFVITRPEGYNLTAVSFFMGIKAGAAPFIIEIYKNDLTPANRIYAQQVNVDYSGYYEHYTQLNYNINFKQGDEFWVVYHVPSGNKFPVGAGVETSPEYSDWAKMSFDMGKTWKPLEQVLNDSRFCWTISAFTNNEDRTGFLSLDPASGEVAGNGSAPLTVKVDASKVINGEYESVVVVKSNDPKQPFATFPVHVNVSNQKPKLFSREVVTFDNVFIGAEKTLDIQIRNIGYGNMKGIVATIDNPAFELAKEVPWMVSPMNDIFAKVRFKPTAEGNANAKLVLTDEMGYSYTINLTGVAMKPPVITLEPESQTYTDLTIGDKVEGSFSIKNTGNYPLQYFIPSKTDNKGFMEYNGRVHKFGYTYTKTHDNIDYEDISSDGVNVTEFFYDVRNYYYPIEIGFNFPFYNDIKRKINITSNGVLTFQTNSNFNALPGELEDIYSPSGMISAAYFLYQVKTGGNIYYKKFSDKLIVQYDVFDPWDPYTPINFQIVLHDNGDIECKYKSLGSLNDWLLSWYFAGIEDEKKSDGIAFSEMSNNTFTQDTPWKFFAKYPGRNVIDSVTNARGTIAPNEAVEIKYFAKTDSLIAANHFNSINIISNDPVTPQKQYTFMLDVTKGGVKNFTVTSDTLNFGKVFKNDSAKLSFSGMDNGTQAIQINSVAVSNESAISLVGPTSYLQKVGSVQNFDVLLNTATNGKVNEKVTLTAEDGTTFNVVVLAEIIDGPVINTNVTELSQTIEAGSSAKTQELTISNSGEAPLTYNVKAYDWLKLKGTALASTGPDSVSYTWKTNVVDVDRIGQDPAYSWKDITATGQNDYEEVNESDDWKKIDLPFEFNYYGVNYKSIYVSIAGYITFVPQDGFEIVGQFFPDSKAPNNIIGLAMGALVAPGRDYDTGKPETRMAVLTQGFDDYFVIQYNNLKQRFGGDVCADAQIILYKTGEIKFQYRFNGPTYISQLSSIGIENQTGTEGCLVSAYQPFITNNTVVSFVPVIKRVLAPGATDKFDVNYDAKLLNKGSFSSQIEINSDCPENKKIVIPVTLDVTGASIVQSSGELAFGTIKAYATETIDGPVQVEYTKDITIENTGKDVLTVISPEVPETPYLDMRASRYISTTDSYVWTRIWDPGTIYTVAPGQKQMFRFILTPLAAVDINTTVTIATDNEKIPSVSFPLTAKVIEPSVLSIPSREISVNANTASVVQDKSFTVDNTGKSDLTYNLSISYDRIDSQASVKKALSRSAAAGTTSTIAPMMQKSAPGAQPLATETFNRTLSYGTASTPNGFLGFGAEVNFISVTGFTAPDNGFNLSHVSTYYRWDANETSKIYVDILVGSTIETAKPVYSDEFTINRASSDKGEMITLKLNESLQFLSNERFWVAFTYPLGVAYPQGKVDIDPAVSGTFYFVNNDGYVDITSIGSFAKTAWLVRAHESEFKESGWLTLAPTEGTVTAGQNAKINATFKASGARPGMNTATITATSNDPVNPSKTVVAKLYLNEAPRFMDYPMDALTVAENDKLSFKVTLKDVENNTHTLTASADQQVSVTKNGDEYTITFSPDFEASGVHTITLEAKDQYGATRTKEMSVTVTNTNRAPIFEATNVIEVTNENNFTKIPFGKMFFDPDRDVMTYEISTKDGEKIAIASADNGQALLAVIKKIGQATVHVKATDIYGAVAEGDVKLSIIPKRSYDEKSATSMVLYPNPMVNQSNISYTTYREGNVKVSIYNMSGALVRTIVDEKMPSGTYQAQIVRGNLAPGIYLVKLAIDDAEGNSQMIIVQ